MAMHLIKQVDTGMVDGYDQKIWEQYWFDDGLIAVSMIEWFGNFLEDFEMELDQLIYDDGTYQYLYDGNGGFTTRLTPVTPTYSLTVHVSPSEGGTAADLTNESPYEEGTEVLLTAAPNAGYIFQGWRRNGLTIATTPEFTFVQPASGVALVAVFISEETPPDPTPAPQPSTATFYDLELRVAGIQIPMPPFVQKSIEGMLSDVLEGDYSYPVNVPLTPREMAALGLPDDPQTASSYVDPIPAEIWTHGNLTYKGYLDILKKVDDDQVRCTFLLDSGFFIAKNKSLTIPQCYSDEDEVSLAAQTTYAVGGYELRFNHRDLRLRVNGTGFIFLKAQYEDHLSMLEAIAKWLDELGIGLKVTIEYSDDLTDEASKITYWDTTTVTICELTPLSGTTRYTRARRLTSLRYLMEEWGNVAEANRVAFPTVYNRNLYEGNNPLHDGIVNRYDEAGRLYVSNVRYLTFSESFRWEHCIVPYLYLTDVVRQIFKHLRIQVNGEFFESDLVKRMLLYNNRTLDYVDVKINGTPSRRTALAIYHGDSNPDNDSYFYENVHNLLIKLRNHAPEYSVVAFLKGLKNYFGLKYEFNILQNRVEIKFVRSKIRSREVLDLTKQASRFFSLTHGKEAGFNFEYDSPDPLMQDGAQNPIPQPSEVDFTVQNFLALDSLDAELFQIAYVESLRAWFQLVPDQSDPPFWQLYAFLQQPDSNSSGSTAEEDPRGPRKPWTLSLYPLVDSWIAGKKMPAIECTANNREVKLENKECGLRIFAFYGVQSNNDGHPYSYASCTPYDANELLSDEMYDLYVRGADIYPFHADQERIVQAGKEYETTLLLDNYQRYQLSRSPIIRIANLDYILEEKEIQNSTKEYAIAKVKLYKIK